MQRLIRPDLILITGMPRNGKSTTAVGIKRENDLLFHLDGLIFDYDQSKIPSEFKDLPASRLWGLYHHPDFDLDYYLSLMKVQIDKSLTSTKFVDRIIIDSVLLLDHEENIKHILRKSFFWDKEVKITASLIKEEGYIKDLEGKHYNNDNDLLEALAEKLSRDPIKQVTYQCFESLGQPKNNSDSKLKYERSGVSAVDLKNKIAIDVGCNTGYHSFRMADAGATVYAIDANKSFIETAYEMNRKYFHHPNIEFLFGNGFDFFERGILVDVVFCSSVFHYFGDGQKSFIEKSLSILKPGGTLHLEVEVSRVKGPAAVVEKAKRPDGSVLPYPNREAVLEWAKGFEVVAINQSSFQPGSIFDRLFFVMKKV